jgi:transposase
MIKSFEVQMRLNPWLDDDLMLAAKEEAGERCGWFKLQSSDWLEPSEALDVYRHRVGIEHLISSIKSVVNLKPLRVWSKSSVRGSLLLALIAQLQISMLRYDMEPEIVEKMIDGKIVRTEHKPSPKTIIENLGHWTVTLIPRDGWNVERVYSNENELTRQFSETFKHYRRCLSGFRRSRNPQKPQLSNDSVF